MGRGSELTRRLAPAALVAAGLTVPSCRPGTHVTLPPVPGVVSAVVAIDGGDPIRLFALDLVGSPETPPDLSLAIDTAFSGQMTAMLYTVPLVDLELLHGPLELAAALAPDSGPIPRADALYERTLEDRALEPSWREIPEASERVRALSLALASAPACASRGGCLAAGEDLSRHDFRCIRRCPDPPLPAPPARPEPPAPAVLTPCPAGWNEATSRPGGPIHCEPPARAARCGSDRIQPVGSSTCTALGPECPARDFREDLPPGRPVVHVRAGAIAGDGTRAAPFGRIADAIAAAPDGAVIAVAIDSVAFDERITLSRGLTLAGACVGRTQLRGEIRATGAAAIAGLSLRNAALVVAAGGSLELTGIAISGGSISVEPGGLLVVEAARVGDAGGLAVSSGGRLELTGAVIDRVATRPLTVRGRAAVRSSWIGDCADGILVDGGELALEETAIERLGGKALELRSAGTASVSRTLSRETSGLWVSGGSRLSIERSAIASSDGAIGSIDPESLADVRDVVVLRAERGLTADDGATTRARRVFTADAPIPATSWDPRSRLELADFSADRDLAPVPGAIEIREGSRLELSRARLDGFEVRVIEASSSAHIMDIDMASGGVIAAGGGSARVERARITRSLGPGLLVLIIATNFAEDSSRIEASDVELIEPSVRGIEGIGVGGSRASLSLERARVSGTGGVGIQVQFNAQATLRDIVVGASRTTADALGAGVRVGVEGVADLQRFTLIDNEHAGIVVDSSGALNASEGLIEGNGIGAYLADRAFDPRRVMQNVVYRSNREAAIRRP